MTKLTKRSVDAAERGEKVRVIWDEELRGFGLRVYRSCALPDPWAGGRSSRF